MTVPLLVLRHGPTAWNAEKRCQGHADVPLSPEGVDAVRRWRLPPEADGGRWLSSPLRRCLETARLLGADPAIDAALIEMDWGDWEGERLPELRARLGMAMAANEARGLDFRPAGGESPRDVQQRLKPWLSRTAAEGAATVAVTHRGVLRALYALASGWDMTGESPHRLTRHGVGHLFALAPDGAPAVERLNIPLEPAA